MSEGPSQAWSEIEGYQAYLSVLAHLHARGPLQGKIDPSGVVQQTLLEAYQARAQLEPLDPAQRAAWLRRALANNLTDEVRKHTRQKCDAGRQRSLEELLDQSASRLRALAGDQTSPSEYAAHNEQELRLAWALSLLPPAQREAVALHHLQQLSLNDVAARLGRSRLAVVGLLHRGLRRLRELLDGGTP